MDVAGVRCVVVRKLFGVPAVELLRDTRKKLGAGMAAILTGQGYVHPYYERMRPLEKVTLAKARASRRKVVDSSPGARRALNAIARAKPLAKAYDERDSFLELRDQPLALVVVKGSWRNAVRPFIPDGDRTHPRDTETLAFLEHFHAKFGATPLFADGARLELEVRCPPTRLRELRALARDVFLLSQGVREGIGFERPSRLLRRLTSDRWVIWWYGV